MFKRLFRLTLQKGINHGDSAVEFIKKVAFPIFEKEVNNAEIKLWEMSNKACDKRFQTDSETHFKNADNSDLISEIMDMSLEFGQNILQPAGSILDIHKYTIPTVPSTILHDRDNGQFLVNMVKPKYAKILHGDCESGEVSGRRNKVIPESQRSITNEIKPKYATILHRDCESDEVSGRRNKVIPQSEGSITTDTQGGIYYPYYLIFQSDLTSQDGHSIIPRTFDDLVNTLSQGNWEQTCHRQSLLEYIMSVSSLSREEIFHFDSVGQNDDLHSASTTTEIRNPFASRNLMNKKRHPELVPKMKRQQLSGNQVRNEKDDSTEQQKYDISAKETIGMTPKPKQTFRTNPEIRNTGWNSADTKPIEDPSDSQVNHRKGDTYYTDDSRMDTKYKCLYKLPSYNF